MHSYLVSKIDSYWYGWLARLLHDEAKKNRFLQNSKDREGW